LRGRRQPIRAGAVPRDRLVAWRAPRPVSRDLVFGRRVSPYNGSQAAWKGPGSRHGACSRLVKLEFYIWVSLYNSLKSKY